MASSVLVLPPALLAQRTDAYLAAIRAKQRQLLAGAVIFIFVFLAASIGAEVKLGTFFGHLDNFTGYFGRLTRLDTGASVLSDPQEWFWGLRRWMRLLGETLLIAYVATLSGALIAFAGSFCASRNLTSAAWLRIVVLRCFELLRTVPDLVFALVFVVAFGLGPLPGVLAITLHSAGTLGKLFTEIVETIDLKPVEGIASSGGGWLMRIRFGAIPQVLSSFASYTLLRLEVNVRGATVIGFVGAGGIGTDLLTAIRKFFYSDVSAMLILIVISVSLLDMVSERIRHRLMSLDTAA